jgi:spermidine/putrescine transport system substrate-binding protein
MIYDESPAMRFSRREFLKRSSLAAAALSVGPAILAACGGSSSQAAASPGAPLASPQGSIDFYSWQGYDLSPGTAVMDKWVKDNNVTMHATYVNTHNDITAKFTTGGGKGIYNLSTYEAGYGPFYVGLGIPMALDVSKVPNFQQAYPIFRSGAISSKWWNFNGHQWALPFTWGLQGINYDANKIQPPASYRDLLGPSFKNKFGVTDDPVAAIVIGAHALGIFRVDSLYTTAQLNSIIGFWGDLKKNARVIVPSYGNMADLFVAGEIVAATPGWAAVNSFAAAKGLMTVKHTLPSEGSAMFCDAFFIPSGAQNVDTVYQFINLAFSAEAQAQEAANLVQAAVNPKAVDLMSADTKALYPYDKIDTLLKDSAPLEAIPAQGASGYASFDDWNKAWESFKAS